MLTSVISTVIVLGVLIFVHELGHFLVAKRTGVTVLRFSLGFGPKIFGITRGGTDYRLSLIPLGGYVKMLGEDSEEELPQADRTSAFSEQKVGKRLAIVFAGPVDEFHRSDCHLHVPVCIFRNSRGRPRSAQSAQDCPLNRPA